MCQKKVANCTSFFGGTLVCRAKIFSWWNSKIQDYAIELSLRLTPNALLFYTKQGFMGLVWYIVVCHRIFSYSRVRKQKLFQRDDDKTQVQFLLKRRNVLKKEITSFLFILYALYFFCTFKHPCVNKPNLRKKCLLPAKYTLLLFILLIFPLR